MPWLAVTLELEAALAEDFSEALLEAGAESVWLENPTAPANTVNALLSKYAQAESLVAAAAAACGMPATPRFTVSEVEDADWVRRTQAQFTPLRTGRLWVGAGWHEPDPGCVVVRIDPGMAFGTGSHPTTRLMLRYVERAVGGGERVLDYGCGSGILAIAAAKLGAQPVDGTDIDPGALETSAENARRNGVVLGLRAPEAVGSSVYDIVLANILAQPLIVLAPLLSARCAPVGRIALAGLLESQIEEVSAAYSPWFAMTVPAREEGWALLEGRRK